jgi:transcriptional regulator with XRE-family HTH domain
MQYSTHLLRHLRLTIGQNIHTLRARRKLPLAKLSRLSGVSEAMIDQYELGKHQIPLEHLLRIACALKAEVGELIPNYQKIS